MKIQNKNTHKTKIPTVTIGIPAYNEEANIGKLLQTLFSLRPLNHKLSRVIIISDGSTDNTEAIVKSFKNKITLVSGKVRKGKYYRLNQLFRISNSDLLVLIDADCIPDVKAINETVALFAKKEECMLSGSNSIPVYSDNLISKSVMCGATLTKRITGSYNSGVNIYNFRGSLMGIRKDFYKTVKVPETVGTDAYLYFEARKRKYNIAYNSKAKVFFALPNKLVDHLKQSSRFSKSKAAMKKIFGPEIDKEYLLPKTKVVKEILLNSQKYPLLISIYLILNVISQMRYRLFSNRISGAWEMAKSTKYINLKILSTK